MEMKSIGALQDCMAALGLHPSGKRCFTLPARFFNHKDKSRGPIDVTINSNWHSGEGPYLEFNDEIRSFGIRYTQFKPRWQKIRWDPSDQSLTVTGDDYEFSVVFGPLK